MSEKTYTIKVDSVDAALIAGGLAALADGRAGWQLAVAAFQEVSFQLKEQGLDVLDESFKQLNLAKERTRKRDVK